MQIELLPICIRTEMNRRGRRLGNTESESVEIYFSFLFYVIVVHIILLFFNSYTNNNITHKIRRIKRNDNIKWQLIRFQRYHNFDYTK